MVGASHLALMNRFEAAAYNSDAYLLAACRRQDLPSFGRIQSQPELAVTGQVATDSISGKISGGGCELRLMNQNGDIDILQ